MTTDFPSAPLAAGLVRAGGAVEKSLCASHTEILTLPARHILNADLVPSAYPGLFCDEAQDFTTVELELIFRLSLFSARKLDAYYLPHIPFAFAGDPFQTLNPTGFRWEAIKATFHNNVVKQLDPAGRTRVALNFKELAYNYRSTQNIVRFCNLIQLFRAALFQIQRRWCRRRLGGSRRAAGRLGSICRIFPAGQASRSNPK